MNKPIISYPGDSPHFALTPLGAGRYVFPFRPYSARAYGGAVDENYFWYIENYSQSVTSFRPVVLGAAGYDRLIPHPVTKALIPCRLIDEIPPDEGGGGDGMGTIKRVWSAAVVTPMQTWENVRFTRASLDGLVSSDGNYFGVSFDGGLTNHVYSARLAVAGVGSLEDLLIREGGDEVFEPQGQLSLTYADDSHDFTVDLALSAQAVEQNIMAQYGLEVVVLKDTSKVTITGVGIDLFSSISIEGITDGGGYGYVTTTDRVAISFVSSAATPTGQLTLIGGTTEVTATIPPKGSLAVSFISGLEALDFTIPDLTDTASNIAAWLIANTKFNEAVEVEKSLLPSLSGVTITGTQTLDPWVVATGQPMDVHFAAPYNIYDFTLPDVSDTPANITAWIEANTAFGVESQSSGAWVPEVAWVEVVFQTHPSIPDPLGNYLIAPSVSFSVDGFNVLATHEIPGHKVALHMHRRSDNNIDHSSFAANLESMVLTGGEYTGVTTTAQYNVPASALGVAWEVTDPIGGETSIELANPTVQLDVSSSVSALIAQLESMGATDVAITKDSDSISLYWAPADPPVWISGDPPPTAIGIRESTAYTSVEIGGASGKIVELVFSSGTIILTYTAIDQGVLTSYQSPTSLRSLTIVGHSYTVGAHIAMWNESTLVAKSLVGDVSTDKIWVNVADVPWVDFVATHIGDLAYLTVLPGGDDLFDGRITTTIYTEGEGGIDSGDDLPDIPLEVSPQKQMDVIALATEYFVAEIMEKGRIRESIQWLQRHMELKTLEVFGTYVVPAPGEEPGAGPTYYSLSEAALTGFAEPFVGLGLMKLNPAYFGPCLTIFNLSTLETLEVGFVDNYIDIASIEAFAAYSNLGVSQIYNQFGGDIFVHAAGGTMLLEKLATGELQFRFAHGYLAVEIASSSTVYTLFGGWTPTPNIRHTSLGGYGFGSLSGFARDGKKLSLTLQDPSINETTTGPLNLSGLWGHDGPNFGRLSTLVLNQIMGYMNLSSGTAQASINSKLFTEGGSAAVGRTGDWVRFGGAGTDWGDDYLNGSGSAQYFIIYASDQRSHWFDLEMALKSQPQ